MVKVVKLRDGVGDLNEFESLHLLEQFATHLCGASRDDDTGLLECIDLVLGTALSA